ncbi:MAG: WG repeat-containing protein [Muribaculaceae bacterium]|nr:WG repeat-containing protein [Muribaculaceae bacterium]
MKKLLIFSLILFSLFPAAFSQGVSFSVRPGKYSFISPIEKNLFYVVQGDKSGAINGEGKIVVPVTATDMTGFYEDLALVVRAEGGQQRILGILSSDGKYSETTGNYYTVPYQEFFSEGLLTVKDENGKPAYMNPNAVIVKELDATEIFPFSEGYAGVNDGQSFYYIDKAFNKIYIQGGSVAQILGGTNVYKGNAVIWDANGKVYNYDIAKKKTKKTSAPSSTQYDYLCCFEILTKRPQTVPMKNIVPGGSDLKIVSRENKYGYEENGNIVIPYQFDKAGDFYGDYAVVETNGEPGIILYQQSGDSFSVTPQNRDIRIKKNSNKGYAHKFNLNIPSSVDKSNLKINLTDEEGNPLKFTFRNGVGEFTDGGAPEQKTFLMGIVSDGLSLWNGELTYNYVYDKEPEKIVKRQEDPKPKPNPKEMKLSSLVVKLKATRTHADKNDLCSVTATITNPNAVPVKAKVKWTGSSLLQGSGTSVTVPANGTINVPINLKVLKAKSGEKVTVTTSAGGSATITGLQLIPFN